MDMVQTLERRLIATSLTALPSLPGPYGKRLSHSVANKEFSMNKENKPSCMKYVWPWLGFAALITAMWAVFAD